MELKSTPSKSDSTSKMSMNLFGLPYQFPDIVDPRLSSVNGDVGRRFTQNILAEAPICTIIPGVPTYLPNKDLDNKISTANALIEKAGGFGLDTYDALDDLRLYDFRPAYAEYMSYVNTLCSAGAVFLKLDSSVTTKRGTVKLSSMDWKNYRWSSDQLMPITQRVGKAIDNLIHHSNSSFKMFGGGGIEALEDIADNQLFVQFFVDPTISNSDQMSNNTGQSAMKSLFEQGTSAMREIAFAANSGGIDTATYEQFADSSLNAINAFTQQAVGSKSNMVNQAGGFLNRLINLSGEAVKGHNIIIPDIYQDSSYDKSYSVTAHLKSPYGNKLSYFLNIFVPMMHLIAFALPRMETSNSYSSPFLVKAFIEGVMSCNLGIVSSFSIDRVNESFSVDGLPMEVDVTLNISDLYSDLTMTPSDAPAQFANNSNLITFLATNCGMSLARPNFDTKIDMLLSGIKNKFTMIGGNLSATLDERITELLNGLIKFY